MNISNLWKAKHVEMTPDMATVGITYMLNLNNFLLNNLHWKEYLRCSPGDLGLICMARLADEVVVDMFELIFGHISPALLVHHRQACLCPRIMIQILLSPLQPRQRHVLL